MAGQRATVPVMPAKSPAPPKPYTMLLSACAAFAALGEHLPAEPPSLAPESQPFAGTATGPGVLPPQAKGSSA